LSVSSCATTKRTQTKRNARVPIRQLRYTNPLETTTERYARDDLTLAAAVIPRGALLLAVLATLLRRLPSIRLGIAANSVRWMSSNQAARIQRSALLTVSTGTRIPRHHCGEHSLPKTVKFIGISLRTRWVMLFAVVLVVLPHSPFWKPWLIVPVGILTTLLLIALALHSIWLATSQWTRTPQRARLVLSTFLMAVFWLCFATMEAWATLATNKAAQAPPAFLQLAMTGFACGVIGAGLYVRPTQAIPDGTEEPSRAE
jgi:hypothetical protein